MDAVWTMEALLLRPARPVSDPRHCVALSSTLSSDTPDFAPVIHPHQVKHALGDIDPEDVHLVLHWTRLLWLYGFTDRARIVAHRSRSAQGRVHCITTYPGGATAPNALPRTTPPCTWDARDCSTPLPHDRIDNVPDWAHTRGTAHVIGHACSHAKQAGGTYG